MAIGFQALSALVLVHLQAALLLEISHVEVGPAKVLVTCSSVECNLACAKRPTQPSAGNPVQAPATVE